MVSRRQVLCGAWLLLLANCGIMAHRARHGTSGKLQTAGGAFGTAARSLRAVEDCTPVDGLTTSFERAEFNPFTLSQTSPSHAIYAPQSQAAAHAGSFGALVSIVHSGRQASDVQLTSVPTKLSSESRYTVKFSVKASAAFRLDVQLLEHRSLAPCLFHSVEVAPNTSFSGVEVTHLQPPAASYYILRFDLGLLAANAAVALDDVVVCAEATAAGDSLGTLLPATSTGFESWAALPFCGQMVSPADAAFNLRVEGRPAKTGSYGASVMVRRPGEAAWHIQLAGSPVALSASRSYLVQLSMRYSGPAVASATAVLAGTGAEAGAADSLYVQVAWVEDNVWASTPVATLHPQHASSKYMTYTLPAVSVPHDGSYFLSIELGKMPAGTILHFDDISVREASALQAV